MSIDTRFVAKGHAEDRAALAEEGKAHVELGRKYEKELAAAGWPKSRTDRLEAGVAALETSEAIQADGRQGKASAGAGEQLAITDAKAAIRQVRNVWGMVVRDHPNAGVTGASLDAGAPLGRSTPKISAYITTVVPIVQKLDGPLAQYLGGQKASELLAAKKKALDGADRGQEVSAKSLPAATAQVYEQKGRVLEDVEDMNRIAKNAFDGNAALIAQFNKDILHRARRAAAGQPVPPPAPVPSTPQASK